MNTGSEQKVILGVWEESLCQLDRKHNKQGGTSESKREQNTSAHFNWKEKVLNRSLEEMLMIAVKYCGGEHS